MTNTLPQRKENLRCRMGVFNATGGVFFEQDSAGLKVVVRNYVNGQVVDTSVRQGDWNGDNLNGTGNINQNSTGMNLDVTKNNIYWIDLEWLGAGTVRFGVYYHGIPITCHSVHHENNLTQPYMPTANLPFRFEITNTGATNSSNQMLCTCQSVVSEGGLDIERSETFSANNGITEISCTSERAILSIRPKASLNSIPVTGLIDILSYQIQAKTSDALYKVIYNPTFNTGSGDLTWVSVDDNSLVEYCVHGDANNGVYSGGIVIDSGYVQSGDKAIRDDVSQHLFSKYPIVRDHNQQDPRGVTLTVDSMSGTTLSVGKITWKEVK